MTDELPELPKLPKEHRIQLAINECKHSSISHRKIAQSYGISTSILSDRLHGRTSVRERAQQQQLLLPAEESALKQWIIRLQGWGWPARVEQVRFIAEDIFKKRGNSGNSATIGINWISKYLSRYPELKTKYILPIDKERALAHNPEIIKGWFELYNKLKAEFNVQDKDILQYRRKGLYNRCYRKVKGDDLKI